MRNNGHNSLYAQPIVLRDHARRTTALPKAQSMTPKSQQHAAVTIHSYNMNPGPNNAEHAIHRIPRDTSPSGADNPTLSKAKHLFHNVNANSTSGLLAGPFSGTCCLNFLVHIIVYVPSRLLCVPPSSPTHSRKRLHVPSSKWLVLSTSAIRSSHSPGGHTPDSFSPFVALSYASEEYGCILATFTFTRHPDTISSTVYTRFPCTITLRGGAVHVAAHRPQLEASPLPRRSLKPLIVASHLPLMTSALITGRSYCARTSSGSHISHYSLCIQPVHISIVLPSRRQHHLLGLRDNLLRS